MKKITILLLVILVILLMGGCAPNNSDPVRLAEAARINTQADMDVARQNATLAQANTLAQAQAEATIIEAQARADAQRQTAMVWVVVIAFMIGIPLVILVVGILVIANNQRKEPDVLPRQIKFYVFPVANGRYRLTDEYGNTKLLDWKNPEDARLIAEVER